MAVGLLEDKPKAKYLKQVGLFSKKSDPGNVQCQSSRLYVGNKKSWVGAKAQGREEILRAWRQFPAVSRSSSVQAPPGSGLQPRPACSSPSRKGSRPCMLPSLVRLKGLEWGVRVDSGDHEGSGPTLSLGNTVSTGLVITLHHSLALATVPLC